MLGPPQIATGANFKGQRYGGKGPFFPSGWSPLVHNQSWTLPETRQLFEQHDTFFVDTLVMIMMMRLLIFLMMRLRMRLMMMIVTMAIMATTNYEDAEHLSGEKLFRVAGRRAAFSSIGFFFRSGWASYV